MKKSIISLSVLAVMSAPVMATNVDGQDAVEVKGNINHASFSGNRGINVHGSVSSMTVSGDVHHHVTKDVTPEFKDKVSRNTDDIKTNKVMTGDNASKILTINNSVGDWKEVSRQTNHDTVAGAILSHDNSIGKLESGQVELRTEMMDGSRVIASEFDHVRAETNAKFDGHAKALTAVNERSILNKAGVKANAERIEFNNIRQTNDLQQLRTDHTQTMIKADNNAGDITTLKTNYSELNELGANLRDDVNSNSSRIDGHDVRITDNRADGEQAVSDIYSSRKAEMTALNSSLTQRGEAEAKRLDDRIGGHAARITDNRADGEQAVSDIYRTRNEQMSSLAKTLNENGAAEAERLDKRIDEVNAGGYDDAQLRSEGREFVNSRLQSLDSSVQSRMQDLSTDVDTRLNSAYTSGADEAARLDKRIDDISFDDSALRRDGVQALNSMAKAGFNEAARLDKRIDRINRDGYDDTQLREEASEYAAHVDKDVDSLFKGVSQNFHAITDLKLEHEVLADKGEVAYNSLRADGAREIAKLESVANGVQRTGEIERAKMNDSLRADGAREVAKLESVANGLDRKGELAYNSLAKRIDEVAEKGYDDSQIREDGQAAYEDALAKGEHAYKDLAEKGQEYVDGKFNKLDGDFKETQQAMVVVQNQARQNHEHIGENRQRIADNAAAIEEAKNSGGAAITDADLKAARAEAKQIANNAANKAIEDAVSNVEIDADTAEAVETAVAKVAEKAIADAVSKVDTDAALKEFFDTLNKQDRAIRGDGAAQVARLDGRIDANTKAIEENTKKIEALENRIDGFQDYMNENAAMTNALSGLPQPYGVGKVQVGVGLGFASDKKAVAIGMGYRATDAVVIRAGISKSAGSRGDVQGNVAVGYEF